MNIGKFRTIIQKIAYATTNARQHMKLVPRICSALVLYATNFNFLVMQQ